MKSFSLFRDLSSRSVSPQAIAFPLPAFLSYRLATGCLVAWNIVAPLQAQSRFSNSDIRSEVSRLSANDQRQDLRLYDLERDVDYLQKKATYSPKSPSSHAISSGKSPVLPPPSTAYSVRPGDTLWRIAMTHRVSPGEIMQLNRLSNDSVKVGQKLQIPAKGYTSHTPPSSPTPTPSPKAPAAKTVASSSGSHLITKGQTFSQIAQQYGVSQSALQQANPGVNPNVIVVGSTLAIPTGAKAKASPAPTPTPASTSTPALAAPTPSPAPSVPGPNHTVRSGESLSSIASAHGISAAALQRANNITNPDLLKVGQVLTLPGGTTKTPSTLVENVSPLPAYPTSPQPLVPTTPAPKSNTPTESPGPLPQNNHRGVLSYRVHSTDTIESIASTFGTTPEKIRELNRKPANSGVTANEEILVPAMGAVSL